MPRSNIKAVIWDIDGVIADTTAQPMIQNKGAQNGKVSGSYQA